MFTVTRFCVQPYARRRRVLEAGEAQLFRHAGDAIAAGQAMRRRVAGVSVFKVVGEPGSDLWREPELIMSLGDVPAGR